MLSPRNIPKESWFKLFMEVIVYTQVYNSYLLRCELYKRTLIALKRKNKTNSDKKKKKRMLGEKGVIIAPSQIKMSASWLLATSFQKCLLKSLGKQIIHIGLCPSLQMPVSTYSGPRRNQALKFMHFYLSLFIFSWNYSMVAQLVSLSTADLYSIEPGEGRG